MRRRASKTGDGETQEILGRADYGILSTTCEDGMPYGIPLCFALTENTVYFHCAPEGQKLDNLAHDSRVCLTAVARAENVPEGFTMHYQSALAFGTAHIVREEEERIAALKLLCRKYTPEQDGTAIDAYIQRHIAGTLILRMDIEYMSGKDNRPTGRR